MFQQKKPYSAVTVTIENLTAESYAEDDLSGIPDLVEVIKIQASGPTEAARAIRKKLKYGSPHRQIRALVLLDGLIQNAGSQFQRAFADEPLLERLRVCGTSDLSDPAVRKKCTELFREWSQYGKTPGLERVSRLYKELPKRKVAMTQETSKVIKETDNPFGDDEEEEMEARRQQERQGAAGSSRGEWRPNMGAAVDMHGVIRPGRTPGGFGKRDTKKDKSKRKSKDGGRKPFNLEAEKEKMKSVIAESSISSTNLMNTLQTINRERERISENQQAVKSFEACKQLRRRILRYIHQVDSEQWLGSLLHANDELVHALMAFEQMDHSIDADSDSDDEIAEQAHMYRMVQARAQEERAAAAASPTSPNAPDLAGLSLDPTPKHTGKAPQAPPVNTGARPGHAALGDSDDEAEEEAEEEDNPFGDSNVVETPAVERGEPRW